MSNRQKVQFFRNKVRRSINASTSNSSCNSLKKSQSTWSKIWLKYVSLIKTHQAVRCLVLIFSRDLVIFQRICWIWNFDISLAYGRSVPDRDILILFGDWLRICSLRVQWVSVCYKVSRRNRWPWTLQSPELSRLEFVLNRAERELGCVQTNRTVRLVFQKLHLRLERNMITS